MLITVKTTNIIIKKKILRKYLYKEYDRKYKIKVRKNLKNIKLLREVFRSLLHNYADLYLET